LHHFREVVCPNEKVYVCVHQAESIEFGSVLFDVFVNQPQEVIPLQRVVKNKVLKIGNENDVEKSRLLPRPLPPFASMHLATILKNSTSRFQLNCADFKGKKFSLYRQIKLMGGAGKLGCNAHIVRLADIQRVSKNDPRGYEIDKCLIMSQTNNVCVAPFLFLLSL